MSDVPDTHQVTTWPLPDRSRDTPEPGDLPEADPDTYGVGAEVARGGLGRINRAIDRRLGRVVALKQLLAPRPDLELRFTREAQITARLQHPGIVPVHEAGRWPDGRQFYAMKLVDGQSLRRAIRRAPELTDRLALVPHVLDVADAIAYAHSERVIHRDLKPTNVLVGPFGETVVIDWGLAKVLGEPSAPTSDPPAKRVSLTPGETAEGEVLGTPNYMPPEQARGERVDERADVFALGAILYEVLTGLAPYEEVAAGQVVTRVLAGGPVSCTTLAPGTPPELIAIVEKAMARAAPDRYPSALELADELRRFTTGQLVAAHTYTRVELMGRFVDRNRGAVLVAMLAFFVLFAGGAWSVVNIAQQRNQARAARDIAEARVDQLTLARARALLKVDPTAAVRTLAGARPIFGVASVVADARGLGVARRVLRGHDDEIRRVVVSPDGRRAASASDDKTLRVWELSTGRAQVLRGHKDRVASLAFSPDGKQIASGAYDNDVRIWTDAGSRRLVGHTAAVKSIAFSSDGRSLASFDVQGNLRIWDIAKGTSASATASVDRAVFVAWLPGDDALVTAGHHGALMVWDRAGNGRRLEPPAPREIDAFGLRPGAREAATGDRSGRVLRWHLDSGKVDVIAQHVGAARAIAFSADGASLASAGVGGIMITDVASGRAQRFEGHTERIDALAFSADGTKLASGSWDRTACLWDLPTGESTPLLGHGGTVSTVAFTPDGQTLLSGSWDRSIRVWPVRTSGRRVLRGHRVGVRSIDFSPDGQHVASAGHDDQVRTWPLAGGERRTLSGHTDHVYRVLHSPDGEWIASSSDDRTVRLWSRSTAEGRVLGTHDADVEELAFSPDGRWLASAGEDNKVGLWPTDGAKGELLEGHSGHVTAVAFSGDGRYLASSSRDGTVRLLEVDGRQTRIFAPAPAVEIVDIAFAGADALVVVDSLGAVHRWRFEADATSIAWSGLEGARLIEVSSDGRSVAVAGTGSAIWMCRVDEDDCRTFTGHAGAVRDLAFDATGRLLVSGSGDHTLRIWDTDTGESTTLEGHRAPVFDLSIAPDGGWVASASGDATVRLWRVEAPPSPENLPAAIEALIEEPSDRR